MIAHLLILCIALLASSETLAQDELNSQNSRIDEKAHRFSYDNRTYEISQIKDDWYFANYDCASKGMEVVSIESWGEYVAIVNEIRAYNQSFWTSGGNKFLLNKFVWESTGQPMGPFMHWAQDQPNYNLDCVTLNSSVAFSWHSASCANNSLRYICEERDKVSDENLQFSVGATNYSISSLMLDWRLANYKCRSKGMRLLSIDSAEENEAVSRGISAFKTLAAFWTSGTNLGRSGEYYWDSTGEYFGIFSNWIEGQPSVSIDARCVSLTSDWNDPNDTFRWTTNSYCVNRFRFICESVPLTSILEFTSENGSNNRFEVDDSVYEISNDKADRYLASIECKIKGMELLSIDSFEEQDAIIKLIENYTDNFWTSGSRYSSSARTDWDYYWDSTGHINRKYSNWGAGRPDVKTNGHFCMFLNHTDSFKWHDIECSSQHFRYICEKKAPIDETIRFTFFNNTYELSNAKNHWSQANRDCRSRGMRLVSIESEAEDAAIIEALERLPLSYGTWTSGCSFGRHGEYYWESTGEFLGPYLNWAPYQPTNENTVLVPHCIQIKKGYGSNESYQWADDMFGTNLPYICEKSMDS